MKSFIFAVALFATVLSACASRPETSAGQAALDRGDYGAAFHHWLPLARGGDMRAQQGLGLLYENGWGVKQDVFKAQRWYERAGIERTVQEISPDGYPSGTKGKKLPPIAEPMYLSAYASMVTRSWQSALKSLTHLITADPAFADFQNAMALALFTANPDKHAVAFKHTTEALAMAPNTPQFVVTHVLTDRSQWKVEDDGTARLTQDAALRLMGVRERLLIMSGNAKKLGRILNSIEETGGDPNFPFVLADYKKLVRKPSLALTRPAKDDFDVAQWAIEKRIRELKAKLAEDKKAAQEGAFEAEERQVEIEREVAEAAEGQEEREDATVATALDETERKAEEAAREAEAAVAAADQRDYGADFHQWLPLARNGDVRAQKGLGQLYENGWGVAPDSCKARRWYERAETDWRVTEESPDGDTNCPRGKLPPLAGPMYLTAYANMITRHTENAIKPLTHLVAADPTFADVRNALAMALFVVRPEEHSAAFLHASKAVALAPDTPQFVVTHVLTDLTQWNIEDNGTAYLTRDAAKRLIAVRSKLLRMSGNRKVLGRLLESVEEQGDNQTYPFVFADYAELLKEPTLALTRPADDDFDIAQKRIVERILKRKQELEDDD
jgi:hypothetical protein